MKKHRIKIISKSDQTVSYVKSTGMSISGFIPTDEIELAKVYDEYSEVQSERAMWQLQPSISQKYYIEIEEFDAK